MNKQICPECGYEMLGLLAPCRCDDDEQAEQTDETLVNDFPEQPWEIQKGLFYVH